jgi:hypothetical protein
MNLPSGKSTCCGFCGEPLQFVLQVLDLCENNTWLLFALLFLFMNWVLFVCRFMHQLRTILQHFTERCTYSCAQQWLACAEISMNSGSTSTGILVEGEASPMAVVIMFRPLTLHFL